MAAPLRMPTYEALIPSVIEVGSNKISVRYEKTSQLETEMTVILDSSAMPFSLKKLAIPSKDIQSFLGCLLSEEGIGTLAIAQAILRFKTIRREAGESFLRSNALYALFPFPILQESKVGGDYYCFALFADMRGVERGEWFNLSAYFRGAGVMGEVGVVCLKTGEKVKVTQHEVINTPS